MKAGINKVFLELMGEPILCHTLRAFAALPEVQELIVVTGRDEVEPLRRLLADRTVLGPAEASKSIKVVEGGSERQYSVWNGLKASSEESDVVLVHDAARPLIRPAVIEAVIEVARAHGGAIAAVPEKNTVKVVDAAGVVVSTPARSTLWAVQTPQGFRRVVLDEVGVEIVSHIAYPMIAGALCIGLIIKLVQDLDDEKELIAAKQAKLALDIANKTLPFFQNIDRHSLSQVCGIIRSEISADAVAITDTRDVLAYVGVGKDYYELDEHHAISDMTHRAVLLDQIIINNDLRQYHLSDFHSVIIIPLRENGAVSGTLKIYYRRTHSITSSLKEMAVGLSQLISTQMEVSRIEQLKEMTRKAEFTALQSKINPHFLFNALNAISSLIRIRPQQARQLIANLADYLRYNLNKGDTLIDIQEELQQVRDYVAIEQARFGDKLEVVFEVDDVHIQVPSLLLQPLVENAILHGIQPRSAPGRVTIEVKQLAGGIRVAVRDTGYGISQAVIDGVAAGRVESRSIGLMNVHQRVKLLYGDGLHLKRLEPGTEVCFYLPDQEAMPC